jgi:hypothetical protein
MAKIEKISPDQLLLNDDTSYTRAGDNLNSGAAPVKIKPFINEDGTVEPDSGGYALVNEEQADFLVDQGRLKPSEAQALKETIKEQQRLEDAGKDWSGVAYKKDDQEAPVVPKKQDASGPAFVEPDSFEDYKAPVDPVEPQIVAGIPSENRVRLYSTNAKNNLLMGGGLMDPLLKTGFGIIFPYTPTIMWNYSANYGTYDTTHSVYQQQYWQNTPNPTIQITATFTATTIAESEYSLASLHFLRFATKGDFGAFLGDAKERNATAGSPPPVLLFSAYGSGNAEKIPVVVRGVNYTYAEDVDFVTVDPSKKSPSNESRSEKWKVDYSTSIPVQFVMSIDLAVQQTPANVQNAFNVREYATGKALTKGFN